jgi:hypothetical protein
MELARQQKVHQIPMRPRANLFLSSVRRASRTMVTNVKLDEARVGGEIILIEQTGSIILSVDVDGDLIVIPVVEGEELHLTINETPPGHPLEIILLIIALEIMSIVLTLRDLHLRHLQLLLQQFIILTLCLIHLRIPTLNQGVRIPLPRHGMMLDGSIHMDPVRGIMMIVEVDTILESLFRHHHHIPLIQHHPLIWIQGVHTIEMDIIENQIQQITDEVIPDQGTLEMIIPRHHRLIRNIHLISTHDIGMKVLYTIL